MVMQGADASCMGEPAHSSLSCPDATQVERRSIISLYAIPLLII